MNVSSAFDPGRKPQRWRSLQALVTGLQAYVILGGLVSLFGWLTDRPRWTSWDDSGISIQPNATIAVIAAGAAITLVAWERCRPARALGLLVTLIGASVIFEYLSGVDLGIDTLLMFDRPWGHMGTLSPGRMGPPGAISWTLIGIGIVFASLPRNSWPRRSTPVLAVTTASIAALGLIGYLYGARSFYSLPSSTVIALQTASFVFVASLGLLLSVPEHGPVALLLDDSPAGVLTRRVAPVIVCVPVVLGFARLLGERAGYYDTAFGSALRTVLEMLAFLLFLGWTGNALRRHDQQRADADRMTLAGQQRVVDTLEHITDAFVTLDPQWRFTYVNSEAERLLGKDRRELLGRAATQLLPRHVDGEARGELERAAKERVNVAFEQFDPVLKRWFAHKAYPTADGMLAVYFEDITARKTAEQELASSRLQLEADLGDAKLLQSISTELLAQEDGQRFYESIVVAAARLMRSDFASMQMLQPGRDGRSELKLLAHRGFDARAAEFWDIVHDDSGSTCGAAFKDRQRIVVANTEQYDFGGDAETVAMYRHVGIRAVQSTPLVSRTGQLLGMISTHWRSPHVPLERELRLFDILARQAADLLERRQLEQQRADLFDKERTARSSAEHAGRLKDEFLATLSHELRTPLNAVIGWSHILKNDLSDAAKARTAIDVIERNARLQAQLITDLLDVSRIISGNMRLDVQSVELPAVIAAAIDSIMPAAEAKGVRVERVVEPLAEKINGDPARLQQVVWNLLSNAVKFTPRGGRVQVVVASVNSHVEVRVSDTGEGIAPAFLPHIFERFRQADATPARAHGGLGLGLAIVKQLVELHGGRVRASSDGKDQGSTFVIELPFAILSDEERSVARQHPKAEPVHPAPDVNVPLPGVRVLVVDDDPDGLAMIRRVLEESGAEVTTAFSSQSALVLLNNKSFDVLVSDIGMPGCDGYELMTRIRQRGIRSPAVALTAFARAEDRTRAMLSGYQAHVSKPVEAGELLATIAALAGKRAPTLRPPVA